MSATETGFLSDPQLHGWLRELAHVGIHYLEGRAGREEGSAVI